jgi:hypothetical protein
VVDLPEREIVTSLVQVDKCEQTVGARRHRIERQGFLRERFGSLEFFFLTEFRPSRNDGFETRAAERGIGLGLLRLKVDRGLEKRGSLVFLFAACMRHELAPAHHVFVSREVFGRLRKKPLPLEPGELHSGCSDDASRDVVLHGKCL